ncbi:MAG: ABC transporter permease [Nocardioidaceae bacterium]|nr:ABC transporter permease [Nocardioidaceae bacterium]
MRTLRLAGLVWPPLAIVAAVVLGWHLLVVGLDVSPFVAPTPGQVAAAVGDNLPVIVDNTWTTLAEAGLGLLMGNVAAVLVAVLFCYVRRLRELFFPMLLALQAVPIIAVAPILILWLGPGLMSKAVLGAFITFPITLVSLAKGFESCPREVTELLYSLKASKRQEILLALAPSALPMFMAALKLGASTAVLAALAAEYVGAQHGLGFLIQDAQTRLEVPLMWGVVLVVMAVGVLAYALFAALERALPAETTTAARAR